MTVFFLDFVRILTTEKVCQQSENQKSGSEFDLFANFVFHLHVGEPFEIQLSRDGHGIFDMQPVFALDAFDAVYIGIIGVV